MDSPCTSFIPSNLFQYELRGYVFKTGEQGLGYYQDTPAPIAKLEGRSESCIRIASDKSNLSKTTCIPTDETTTVEKNTEHAAIYGLLLSGFSISRLLGFFGLMPRNESSGTSGVLTEVIVPPPQAISKPGFTGVIDNHLFVDGKSVLGAADYIPASTFEGEISGYSFKTGQNGLGYYRDTQLTKS